jgi:CheY-like chemotaxis protein
MGAIKFGAQHRDSKKSYLADPRRIPGWDPEPRHLSILVVDDNQDFAESLAILLRMSGHDVRAVFDGPSAVKTAAEWHPQVVLQDIEMPGMSGYGVARALRQLPVVRDAMLIALSGSQYRHKSEQAGFNYHLIKPVDFVELHRLLDRAANDAAHADPNASAA